MIVRIMMDSHGIVSPISPLITILPIRTKYKARNFFISPAIRLRITKKPKLHMRIIVTTANIDININFLIP